MSKWQQFFDLTKANQNQHLEFTSVFHQNCIKKYIETSIFCSSKLGRKKFIKMTQIFCPSKLRQSTSKWGRFFARQNYVQQVASKQRQFFALWNYIFKKVHRNNVDLSLIKITSSKYVETTSLFHPSKLHQKSTSKSCWKLSIFSLQRTDIISPSNRRRFNVVCPLGLYLPFLILLIFVITVFFVTFVFRYLCRKINNLAIVN